MYKRKRINVILLAMIALASIIAISLVYANFTDNLKPLIFQRFFFSILLLHLNHILFSVIFITIIQLVKDVLLFRKNILKIYYSFTLVLHVINTFI